MKNEERRRFEERHREERRLWSLQFRLIFFVSAMMLLSLMICSAVVLLLHILTPFGPFLWRQPALFALVFCLPSILIGTALTAYFSRWIRNPLREMTEAAEKMGKGDLSVRVGEKNEIHEFRELQKHFNRMAEDLSNIEVFRNDFVNNFSHEFKTPIVSIRGFAHELLYGDLTEEQKKEYLEIICKESDRLSEMSSAVLLLSRFENQTIVTGQTEYDLDEQIRDAIVLLEKAWDRKELELDIDLEDLRCTANEEMLSQIWINLLSNAIKFTPEHGRVGISLRREGKNAVVRVSDSGIGMSEEVKKHIFEKFYQGDTSHRGAGNGIGLTLVSRIVVLCNGTIAVESEENKGSTFTVTLPILE